MKLPAYLRISRHHVYSFRRRIPDDLQDRFATNELRYSLKTKDRRQAIRLSRICALKVDLLFDYLRRMAKKKNPKGELLKTDMVVSFDMGELGRLAIDYDPTKAGEKEEVDRRIEQLQKVE